MHHMLDPRLILMPAAPGSGQARPATVAATFLWSPLAIASCVGFSTGCFENAAALMSIAAAAAGSAPLAAAAAVTAAYLGLYPLLLLVCSYSCATPHTSVFQLPFRAFLVWLSQRRHRIFPSSISCPPQAPLALLLWRGPEDLSVAEPPVVTFAHPEPSVTTAKLPSQAARGAADSTAATSGGDGTGLSSKAAAEEAEPRPRYTGERSRPAQRPRSL